MSTARPAKAIANVNAKGDDVGDRPSGAEAAEDAADEAADNHSKRAQAKRTESDTGCPHSSITWNGVGRSGCDPVR